MADAHMQENSQGVINQTDRADYLSYHDTPIVEVVVGGTTEPERIFHIHEGVLVKNSGFFKSALQPHFTSGEQKKVCLPEESVEHFSTFARWVYNRNDLGFEGYLHYAKVYILADRLIAPALKEGMLFGFRNNIEDDLRSLSSGIEDNQEVVGPLAMNEVIELAKIVYA